MGNEFKVGEEVLIIAMGTFLSNGSIPVETSKAKITKVEELPNGTKQYKLKGYTGWWPETILKKIPEKYYYLIETTDSEYTSSYKKICESYEEAEKEIKNYSDWYCSKGSCTIVKVTSNFKIKGRYKYWEGKLTDVYF